MSNRRTVDCPVEYIDALLDVATGIGEAMKILDGIASGELTDAPKASMRGHGWLAAARSKVDRMRAALQSQAKEMA